MDCMDKANTTVGTDGLKFHRVLDNFVFVALFYEPFETWT